MGSVVTIPILPSRDFDETVAFWAPFGFAEIGRWPNEYVILRHAPLAIELHFWPNPDVDRWTNDVACYVRFADAAAATAWREEWSAVVAATPGELSPLRVGPAGPGSVEFHVIDAHGNLVRFGGFAA